MDCIKQGKLRYIKNHKTKTIYKDYCIHHADYEIISLSCIIEKKCDALSAYKHMEKLKPIGTVGSPTHKKCYFLGGNARLVEYFSEGKWSQVGICMFKDSSFITTENSIK